MPTFVLGKDGCRSNPINLKGHHMGTGPYCAGLTPRMENLSLRRGANADPERSIPHLVEDDKLPCEGIVEEQIPQIGGQSGKGFHHLVGPCVGVKVGNEGSYGGNGSGAASLTCARRALWTSFSLIPLLPSLSLISLISLWANRTNWATGTTLPPLPLRTAGTNRADLARFPTPSPIHCKERIEGILSHDLTGEEKEGQSYG